jgi:energy-coupling factor transport system substrate-specific component
MPIAIAINIVLGATVANALKVPIYLDSIGTILVGVLCGPLAGALTGFLANLLWSYLPPPFQYQPAAAFAVVAAAIGLLAGTFGRIGWFRPRPGRNFAELALGGAVAIVIVAVMVYYGYTRFYGPDAIPIFNPDGQGALFTILGWVVVALALVAIVGFIGLLFVRRDLTVAYVVVAGVLTGAVAAVISAPIAANVFGGVTGSGVDFLVAAFRQAGADLQTATLQQGLLVDPIDKMLTSVIVYLVVAGMAHRVRARFPQGDRLVDATQIEESPA